MPSSHLILCRLPFSSCPQSLPASESFPMSQLFTWGGQSTGVSALASFLPKLYTHVLCPQDILNTPKTYSFQNVQIINILPFLILKLIFHYNSHMNDQHHLVIQTQAWKLLFTLLTSYLHTKTFIHSDQFCVPDFLKYIYFCHFHCYFIVTTALEMCLYLQCCLF